MNNNLEFKREKTDQIIQTNFTKSCMNDVKWVQVIDSLIENFHLIPEISLKLVWDENLRELFLDESTGKDHDYYAASMEGLVSGAPRGWYDYKEIEWVEFQENGQIVSKVLDSIGKFEYQLNNDKLKLYGYK